MTAAGAAKKQHDEISRMIADLEPEVLDAVPISGSRRDLIRYAALLFTKGLRAVKTRDRLSHFCYYPDEQSKTEALQSVDRYLNKLLHRLKDICEAMDAQQNRSGKN